VPRVVTQYAKNMLYRTQTRAYLNIISLLRLNMNYWERNNWKLSRKNNKTFDKITVSGHTTDCNFIIFMYIKWNRQKRRFCCKPVRVTQGKKTVRSTQT